MAWHTLLSLAWYQLFLYAFWDASRYNWDDSALTWDAVSIDPFYSQNATTFATKNRTSWATQNSAEWC